MARILSLAFLTNLALGLFNLIPIPPLDGSRILGAFLPRNAYEKWAALDQYGMFLVLGMLLLFRGPFARLVWWVVDALSGAFGVHLSTIF